MRGAKDGPAFGVGAGEVDQGEAYPDEMASVLLRRQEHKLVPS